MSYRTDIEYIASFNPRQAPPVMNYVAAVNGYAPIDLNRPFRYCDLGCGPGATLLVLAAAFPQGEFWGVDFNENHVRMGKSLAEAAGLTNVRFVLSDFCDLAPQSLPMFHFGAVSGTLSWLAEEPFRALLNFLGDRLEPGGLAYLHYMAMPGHGSQPPICRLASDYYHQVEGDPEERVFLVKEFLRGFLNTQKRYFEVFPPAKTFLEQMLASSTSLFLHDYLSKTRNAYYFADLAREMTQRGFRYAGSSEYFYNHVPLVVPMESRELFRGVRDRLGVESIKDFVAVSGGRTDVFCKTVLPPGDESPLESVVVGVPPGLNPPQAVGFPGMSVRLDMEPMASLLTLLRSQPATLAELYRHPQLGSYPRHEVRKALTYGVAARLMVPLVQKPGGQGLTPYNRSVLAKVVQEPPDRPVVLASPVVGNGHVMSWVDGVMLWSLISVPPAEQANLALSLMRKQNLGLKFQSPEGKELSQEEAIPLALQNAARQFGPLLTFLGILTEANLGGAT
ncbi:MAG: methyltransferase domain-containing protein [Pseudanabaenaceae cyanobacterium]